MRRPVSLLAPLVFIACDARGGEVASEGPDATTCDGGIFTIASGAPIWGFNLAIDDESAYWTQFDEQPVDVAPEVHGVWKAPLTGGPATEIWRSDQLSLWEDGMAVANGHVFVSNSVDPGYDGGGSTLFSVPTGGGDASAIATKDSARIHCIAVDSTYVYACSDATIFRVPQSGGAATTLCTLPGAYVEALAVLDGQVFATALLGDGGVTVSVPLDGGTPVTMAAIQGWDIAVDSTSVYLTAGTGVLALPRDGGPARQLASGLTAPTYLALDHSAVYVGDIGTYLGGATGGGSIERVPLDGGPLVVLASGQQVLGAMVVNEASVVWATELGDGGDSEGGDGTVMKVGNCSR